MNRRLFLKGLGLAAAATAAGGARAIDRAPSAPIESFTFAFFTDVHLRPDLQAPEGARMAMEVINRSGADFAICGGDHILDGLARSREHILQQYALYRIIEKQLRIPVRHVLGNHDVAGVLTQSGMSESDPVYGKALFRDMFDTPTYYRFEHKGVQFIVLDSIQIAGRGWEPRIDDEQIAWLQRTLDAHRDMMTIVITHVPLATSISNYYPGSESAIFTPVVNNREIIPLLEQYKVKAVLQGHTHILEDVERHGIHYITGGAVSGNWWHGAHFGDREGVLLVKVAGGSVTTSYAPTGFLTVDPVRS